jgi:hypothetical protein
MGQVPVYLQVPVGTYHGSYSHEYLLWVLSTDPTHVSTLLWVLITDLTYMSTLLWVLITDLT